jgi:ribosomal protein L29
MATEKDEDDKTVDELEVVEVDALPAPGEEPKAAAEDKDASEEKVVGSEEDDEDDDHEDARLADKDADPDADGATDEKQKRLNRRKRQKDARDRTLAELDSLRKQVVELQKGQAQLQGASLATGEAQVKARLEEVRKDIATAEAILAEAVKAGNGDDYVTAQRLRDEAKDQERDLIRAEQAFTEAKKAPVADPAKVTEFGAQWKAANPWYKPDGSDNASAVVNAIDYAMINEGLNPADRAYWTELTRRVAARVGSADAAPKREDKPDKERRKAPPLGNGREHATESTRQGNRVYVTPERKQAMIDAGLWDDPKERAATLKAYADFDREQSAGR